MDYDFGTGKVGITGGYIEGNIDSDYKSVTDQSGIYAGDEGFDIYVEDNTDLKGGIISGDNTDENKLSTGTLTYEDIKNEAEYEAGSTGVNVNIDNGADYNEKGVTPNIGMPAEDEAESTTKATVSEGEIEIRDKENQKQELAGLNRDTQNSLNKLGEIFDKDSIEERQELAGLFGELAYNQIHFIEGTDEQKAAYHALVGGIMAELTNGDFLAGASAAAVNKLVVEEINKIADGDPAMAQWLSAALGAVITGDKSGASIAASGTKNNFYHLWFKDVIQSLDKSGLDPHKAYAITISADGKDIGAATPSLIIGCYIALDPQNNDIVVFDTTGAQMSLGVGGINSLFKNFGVMITEVAGNTLNLSLDLTSYHIGGSISYDTFRKGLKNGNLEDMFLSSENGLSNNTKLAIAAGLSNTVKMGNASNPLTWTPFGSVKDENIRIYISKYPSDNYLIYQNNITKELSVIAKTDNGYATIVGFDDKKMPQWEHTRGLPDDRFYTLLN